MPKLIGYAGSSRARNPEWRATGKCETEAGFVRRCSRPAEHGGHFCPLSRGRSTNSQNFVAACARCNRTKLRRFLRPASSCGSNDDGGTALRPTVPPAAADGGGCANGCCRHPRPEINVQKALFTPRS